MAKQPALPPSLMVQGLHEVLLENGVPAGYTFDGDSWDDLIIVGFEVNHVQTIRNYTRVGRAHRRWIVEGDAHGAGRGNKKSVTINGSLPVTAEAVAVESP